MSKVRHPAFPSITKDVQNVEAWLRAGWLSLADVTPDHAEPAERHGSEGEDQSSEWQQLVDETSKPE